MLLLRDDPKVVATPTTNCSEPVKQSMDPTPGMETAMTLNPVLLTLWAVLDMRQEESHRSIVRRINHIQPVVRAIGGAASLVTLCAVGLYVWNAWQTIQ